MSKKSKKQGGGLKALLILFILLMIAGTAMMIYLSIGLAGRPSAPSSQDSGMIQLPTRGQEAETVPPETETEPPETTLPDPEHVVSTANIAATGDLLMHTTIFLPKYTPECYNPTDESYHFDSIFKHIKENVSAADYAVANLETTLRGPERDYSGYPSFNTPDEIVDSAISAGFDMLLTANNHCNDTGLEGIKRTLEVIQEKQMDTLGTQNTAEEPKYVVKDINGVKVGMMCYTYETNTSPDIIALNGINLASAGKGMVNVFDYQSLTPFYTEVQQSLDQMKAEGAEATVIYLHWGIEYQLKPNQQQISIAQKLCDMGIDVIVGGHPHVVQPIDLLTSTTDESHKTVCLYSLGNAVSNQRKGNLSMVSTAHTEDGMLFEFSFEKYSDGTVYLADVDILPVWVDMYTNANGRREYNMLPLDNEIRDQWMEKFSISEATFHAAVASYERTMEIVGEGLTECKAYLAEAKEQRDAAYLDAVMNPPAETVPAETAEAATAEATDAAA